MLARGDAIAVELGEQKLTYRELDGRASIVAFALASHGVTVDSRVGICLDRSIERIVGLVGIVKAGAAYVPIDPMYPDERIAYMLSDAAVSATITTGTHEERLTGLGQNCVAIDRPMSPVPGKLPPAAADGASLAYVMYTSGSTGNPKGVLVTQRGVARMVKRPDYVKLGPHETMMHVAPFTFDGSTFEIWSALLNGGRLVLMPPGQMTLREIGEVVQRSGVTTLLLTSGLFHGMIDHELVALTGLRQLLSGGDVLSPTHCRTVLEALPNCRLINVYGPTENATFTCCHTIEIEDTNAVSVPIGPPIANTTVYILDRARQPVPIGFAGELYTGGDGLALGYTGASGSDKFIVNPFSKESGSRLYATGDRARWRKDGVVEFLGRSDQQIKIRGHRIELGEIENALIGHERVKQAIVEVNDLGSDNKRLVAYYVTSEGDEVEPEILRAFIAGRLPAYMVPSVWVKLNAIPLTRNGKADRSALPAPSTEILPIIDQANLDNVEEDSGGHLARSSIHSSDRAR